MKTRNDPACFLSGGGLRGEKGGEYRFPPPGGLPLPCPPTLPIDTPISVAGRGLQGVLIGGTTQRPRDQLRRGFAFRLSLGESPGADNVFYNENSSRAVRMLPSFAHSLLVGFNNLPARTLGLHWFAPNSVRFCVGRLIFSFGKHKKRRQAHRRDRRKRTESGQVVGRYYHATAGL